MKQLFKKKNIAQSQKAGPAIGGILAANKNGPAAGREAFGFSIK